MEIITAVILFVLGQVAQKFFLEPWARQRETIGQILFNLTFSTESAEQTGQTLRTLAAQLHQSLWQIPFYDTLAEAKLLPRRSTILEITSELIAWSNGTSGNAESHKTRIKELLRRNEPSTRVSTIGSVTVAPVEQKSQVQRLSTDVQTDIDEIIEDQPAKKPRRTTTKKT